MENTKVSWGKNYTPSGTEFYGIKVVIGKILDPSEMERTYEDIEKILHGSGEKYEIHEENRPDGKFRSYSVSTV